MKGLHGGPPRTALAALAAMAVALAPASAGAGDITVFVASSSPPQTFSRGYGAALSLSFFSVLTVEGEAAQMPGLASDANMNSFTASAFISPPIGSLTLYAGLGVGVFRQTLGSTSDTAQLKAQILGAKFKIGGILVVRAEYRKISLPSDAPLPMGHRISAGAGISF